MAGDPAYESRGTPQSPKEEKPASPEEQEPAGQTDQGGHGHGHGHGPDLGPHGDFARGGEAGRQAEAQLELAGLPRVRWTGPAGGRWSDPAHWSGGSVPGEGDVVVFDREGEHSVELDTDAVVAALQLGSEGGSPTLEIPRSTLKIRGPSRVGPGAKILLSGGIVTGAGDLDVRGEVRWSAGSMSGTGTARIAPEGRLTIEGASRKVLSLKPIENAGEMRWEGTGEWVVTFDAPVRNLEGGTFVMAADALFDVYGPPGPLLENAGLVRKVGAGTVVCEPPFTNSGRVEVEEGALELLGGYVQTGGSTTVAAGAAMTSPEGFDIEGGTLGGGGELPLPAENADPVS